jgi:hypothetical protein
MLPLKLFCNYLPFGFGAEELPAFPALAGAFLGFTEDLAILINCLIFPTLLAFRLRLDIKSGLNYAIYIDSR